MNTTMKTTMNAMAGLDAGSAASGMSSLSSLSLLVRQIRFEAIGIHSYELVDPAGADLPARAAGAHIDLHLPGGITRQYSLCNDPIERHRYVIAVLRDDMGRGGSQAVHRQLCVQDLVSISTPRNHFPIAPGATKHLLLAGGIGITPLKAMAHQLARSGQDYELHYCAKGQDYAAFREQFAPLAAAGRVVFHFDGGTPGAGLNIGALLAVQAEGSHLYYCGPAGFMAACATAASHWPVGTVHYEHFKAPEELQRRPGAVADGFLVKIASTGKVIKVPGSSSIVDALGDAGIMINTSCQSGLCGTCKVRFLSGDVDHRDFILSDEEHLDHLTLCVSRCNSAMLVLDM